MSELINLSTAEEAEGLLRRLLDEKGTCSVDPQKIKFSGVLSAISFKIEGERYHGTLPANLARGIWEFQQEIYRSVAFSITGIDDIRKIGGSLDPYTLVFKVSDGSSLFEALTDGLVDALKGGFVNMDSKHKAIVIISSVLILTTGAGLHSIAADYIDAGRQVDLEAQKTDQMKLIADAAKSVPSVNRWIDASENGAKSIVKAASDAISIEIGTVKIEQSQIQEINSRAARDTSDTAPVEGSFLIIGFKRQGQGIARFTLASKDGEFPAVLDEEAFEEDQLNRFWAAAQHNSSIHLQIQITRIGGIVRRAWVSDIGALAIQTNIKPE